MAPYFSEKQLAEMRQHRQTVLTRNIDLHTRFMSRSYGTERGKEFALQGFGRRMGIIARTIEQVFTILPPEREREHVAPRDEVVDVTIALQAFVLNVVGCLDNLAWVWVCEKPVKAKNGAELEPKAVGLWKKHTQVRDSLSSEFREFLDSREPWFEHIRGFRDSLAHRIPLYVPPYGVRHSRADEHRRLEQEATDAFNQLNFDGYDRARAQQEKLGDFLPLMTHSFNERATPIYFHSQMLSDYATIDEFGWKMLAELNAASADEPKPTDPRGGARWSLSAPVKQTEQ
jgi:hypothetical protein